MFKILNFRTEYQTRPLGIDCEKPHFSWQYSEEFQGARSYRICVASSEAALSGSPDMWDSGEIPSDESIGIEYNGKPLRSHSRYYVRLCVTGLSGESTEIVDWFETALYHIEDWKGKWVGIPVNFNGGTLLFRKQIDIPEGKTIARARAYICGLGYHEFFVNGEKAGTSVLNPSVTEYEKRVEYCVYDMKPLHAGANVIGVEIGYGWFGSRKMLAQLYVEYTDGTYFEDHSGPAYGWWVGGSPTIANGIYEGETYDARIEKKYPLNWATVDYEPTWANGWMYTIYAAAPRGKLVAQSIEPIRKCAEFAEVSRKNKGNGITVSDMGVNFAGWVRICVKGERGASVTLKFGEQLDAEGYVNQLNLRSAKCMDRYILKGEGEEVFAPRFTYHGFRYVQCETEGKVELLTITGEHVHTDAPVVGTFECSDRVLNRLHYNAVLTEQSNEHSILTDCPQRDERFGWLNDLGSRIYQSVYNVDLARFMPKFIRDIADTETDKGEIADTAPYYTGGVPADPVCVIFLLLATYSYRYYGNASVAKEHYEKLKAWVEYLKSRSDGYIMDYYYYGDWVLPFPQTVMPDNIYVSTVYLYWHLKEMAKIARIAGNEEDAARYAAEAEESKKAINAKYFDPSSRNYSRGTQTENALAVSLGICEEKYRAEVAGNVYKDVVSRNHHCTGGNIGYRHIFYVLAEYGYTDEAIAVLKNPEYPGWGFMIAKDAGSVWERWEYDMTNEMHSYNHPMFGSYDAFFYKFLGGIDVCENAFGADRISIAPVFAKSVDRVKVTYRTVRGLVVSAWERKGNTLSLHVEIPPQTTAYLTFAGEEKTLSSGKYDFEINE